MATNTGQYIKWLGVSMYGNPNQQSNSSMMSTWNQSTSWLLSSIRNTQAMKEQEKQRIETAQSTQRSNNTVWFYGQSLMSTSEPLQKQYGVASRGSELASMIVEMWKEKGINYTGTDAEVIRSYLDRNPQHWNALYGFTHSEQDPEEFAINMWWAKKESKNLLQRIWWTGLGAVWWLFQWWWNALKRAYNNMWDIYDIATDDDKAFIDKFDQILFGEILFDTIGWGIGEVAWWVLEWWFKWATTKKERKKMSDAAAWYIRTLLETDNWQQALNWWNSLTPEQKKEAEDYLSYIEGATDLIGWVAVKKPVTSAVKSWIKNAKPLVEATEQTIKKGWKEIMDKVDNFSVKQAVKNEAKNTEELKNIANTVWQGTTKDVDSSVKAMQSILNNSDTKWIKTFKDLQNAWRERVKSLGNQIDENLTKSDVKINLSDQKIKDVNGESYWRVIEDAFDDLMDVYSKQRQPEKIENLINLRNKLDNEWLDAKEFNDFIREYGTELNAWNKKNQITTDAKRWWENTRRGMKELLHEKIPDAEFKNIDREMSDVLKFQSLVDDSVEKVNNITKKLRRWWFYTKTVWRALEWWMEILDIVTGKWVSSFLKKTLGVKWSHTMDFGELEKQLPKLLKSFEKLDNQVSKAKTFREADDIVNEVADEIKAIKKEVQNSFK